jgi:hypothetical protein
MFKNILVRIANVSLLNNNADITLKNDLLDAVILAGLTFSTNLLTTSLTLDNVERAGIQALYTFFLFLAIKRGLVNWRAKQNDKNA